MDPWLIWFLVGLALIFSEFFLPGIVLIFFGLAAWIVAAFSFPGFLGSIALHLALFAASAIVLTVCLRGVIWRLMRDSHQQLPGQLDEFDEFTGKSVQVLTDFAGPGALGKVEFKGAEWKARSEDELSTGDTAEIVSLDGLTLNIRKQWLAPFP